MIVSTSDVPALMAAICLKYRATPSCVKILRDWRETRDGQRFVQELPIKPQFPGHRHKQNRKRGNNITQIIIDDDPWGLEDR